MSLFEESVKNPSICNTDEDMQGYPAEIIIENSRMGSTSSQTSNSNTSGGDICRICHCESDTHNPLLAPCYCSGSLKYVHQSCLQQWLTASATRSCELCKFNFIMHTKIKPFNQWRLLEMSGVERRRLCCAVLFHCVAGLCVMWSLFVLIERAVEEVQRGHVAWPFWTKLVVVAVGFTGGAVFMYIQCRQYLHLCNRWRAHNRILLIQNAPEKIALGMPSPIMQRVATVRGKQHARRGQQVVANIESSMQREVELGGDDDSGGFETYRAQRRLTVPHTKTGPCGAMEEFVGDERRHSMGPSLYQHHHHTPTTHIIPINDIRLHHLSELQSASTSHIDVSAPVTEPAILQNT